MQMQHPVRNSRQTRPDIAFLMSGLLYVSEVKKILAIVFTTRDSREQQVRYSYSKNWYFPFFLFLNRFCSKWCKNENAWISEVSNTYSK